MKCDNCKVNIPPEWTLVLQSNECPNCKGEIMSANTKTLLAELTEAMLKMPNDPEGLAGWLMSNYRLEKFGSAEPVQKFYRGKEVEQEVKVAPNNAVQDFFKRAGIKEIPQPPNQVKSKQTSARNIVAQINGRNTGYEREDTGMDVYAQSEMPDPYDDPYMENSYDNGYEDEGVASSGVYADNDPHTVMMLQEAIKSSNNIDDRHPALQAARLKRLQASQNLQSGGAGLIRRK
jgi:hypothetical protein